MLTDGQARRIASEWHSWMVTPDALYALSSTGAIIGPEDAGRYARGLDTMSLLYKLRASDFAAQDNPAQCAVDIIALIAYCRLHGPRGPVEGWSREWDDTPARLPHLNF